jgi:hypothetical protein
MKKNSTISALMLLVVALVLTGCYLLPYNNVRYNPEKGWSITAGGRDTLLAGNAILLKKGGIGTVLDRDGLRLDNGAPTDNFVQIAAVKYQDFVAKGTEGYVICAHNTSTGEKVCVDISICGGMLLQYSDRLGGAVVVRTAPNCADTGVTR